MSLTLITKSGGTVTNKNDGAYRFAVSGDVRLNGCAISRNGNVITMAAGHLLIGGCVIFNDASMTWTLPVTSPYAYVKLTVTASTVTASTGTSSTATVSPGTQEDLNLTGTTYSVILCVCPVTSGALSGLSVMLPQASSGMILYGTTDTPPEGVYPNGTIYIKRGT